MPYYTENIIILLYKLESIIIFLHPNYTVYYNIMSKTGAKIILKNY